MSSVAIIIIIELNHDAIGKVVGGAFKICDISAVADSAKATQKLVDFIWSDSRTIFALKEEET